jgi:hypothetical protein
MNRLVTAAHNIFDETDEGNIQGNIVPAAGEFSICSKSEKTATGGINNQDKHTIKLVGHDHEADWAVLEVIVPGFVFLDYQTLTVCLKHDVPTSTRKEPYYKIYHCPCEKFNNGSFVSLEVVPTSWMKPCAISIERGLMNFPIGLLSRGSSGGCVIGKNGQVVTFHIACESSFMTVEDARK